MRTIPNDAKCLAYYLIAILMMGPMASGLLGQFRELPGSGKSSQNNVVPDSSGPQVTETPSVTAIRPLDDATETDSAEPTLAEPTPADRPAKTDGQANRAAGESGPTDENRSKSDSGAGAGDAEDPLATATATAPSQSSEQDAEAGSALADYVSHDEEAVAALRFRDIQPGTSTVAELLARWGQPVRQVDSGDYVTYVYFPAGVKQVDLVVQADRVQTIVLHLASAEPAGHLAEHLKLADLRAVSLRDESGKTLGLGYPERGVLFSFATDADTVTRVGIEPVGAELFRLRAEQDRTNRFQMSLADLEQAVGLDPDDGQAHWLRAELLAIVGRFDDALDAAGTAVQIAPETPLFRLTLARLQAHAGDVERALRETQDVAESLSTPTMVRARAHLEWGNLLSLGLHADPHQAITHHLQAIQLAAQGMRDPNTGIRRMAKAILIDAHQAVCVDIAQGNFQRQSEVVPKWLAQATELAKDFIREDEGDPAIQLSIHAAALAAYDALERDVDVTEDAEAALTEGRQQIASVDDPLRQQWIERQLVRALYHAARVEHRRGRAAVARKYAESALALYQDRPETLQRSMLDQIHDGQLLFFVGVLHALNDNDHAEAVRWYDRAARELEDTNIARLADPARFGEMFVSMGVSYWETGSRDKALKLTELGSQLMQTSASAGKLQAEALAVPYGNLAAMYESLGQKSRFQHYHQLMAKAQRDGRQIGRR